MKYTINNFDRILFIPLGFRRDTKFIVFCLRILLWLTLDQELFVGVYAVKSVHL